MLNFAYSKLHNGCRTILYAIIIQCHAGILIHHAKHSSNTARDTIICRYPHVLAENLFRMIHKTRLIFSSLISKICRVGILKASWLRQSFQYNYWVFFWYLELLIVARVGEQASPSFQYNSLNAHCNLQWCIQNNISIYRIGYQSACTIFALLSSAWNAFSVITKFFKNRYILIM